MRFCSSNLLHIQDCLQETANHNDCMKACSTWSKLSFKEVHAAVRNPFDPNNNNNDNNIQHRAIHHEFKPVGLTLLKDPLDARWGSLRTLQWVGSWFFRQVKRRFQNRELNRQPLRSDLGTSPLTSGRLGSSWTRLTE